MTPLPLCRPLPLPLPLPPPSLPPPHLAAVVCERGRVAVVGNAVTAGEGCTEGGVEARQAEVGGRGRAQVETAAALVWAGPPYLMTSTKYWRRRGRERGGRWRWRGRGRGRRGGVQERHTTHPSVMSSSNFLLVFIPPPYPLPPFSSLLAYSPSLPLVLFTAAVHCLLSFPPSPSLLLLLLLPSLIFFCYPFFTLLLSSFSPILLTYFLSDFARLLPFFPSFFLFFSSSRFFFPLFVWRVPAV
mmetsp:Transcript_35447/g.92282  ORF Transcript_35447/g.92282 Transcript_35447/m.92282 type:complete len:243 (-) Transcript_35447:57-785(-)